jgi:glutamyl-tRNA reductase
MRPSLTRAIYPASLLLEGKPCLIVGGGKVAARKAGGLLEAGAVVTVISPELDERLAELVRQSRVRYIQRPFQADDPEGFVIVFAATGSKPVNREVLEACRARHVWCCPVDGNWMDGDFVTPAAFRSGPLSVAISTGGQSCRRSRLIKENLQRHVNMVDSADCVVIGTSHQQMDLQGREPFHLTPERMQEVGQLLMHVWGIHEFMLLNTCNRVEIMAVKAASTGTNALVLKILGFDQIPPDRYYVKRGVSAFEHTGLLAAGLLSQMPGENHIVAQLKEALAFSSAQGWASGMISEWMDAALHISKEIRAQIPPDLAQGEIEDAGVRYVCQKCPDPQTPIAVLGTGVIGQGVVRLLARQGRRCQWFYYRNAPVAAAVPEGVELTPWSALPTDLKQAGVVIVTTAAKTPVLDTTTADDLKASGELLLLDLSTPRNIDPAVAAIRPGIELADLDALKAWDNQHSPALAEALRAGAATVHDHKDMYRAIMRSFQSEEVSISEY